MGIASKLLERVACHAQGAGVERLTALCLASNRTVIRLLARLGPTTISPPDAGVVELRIDLTSARPTRPWPPEQTGTRRT